MSADNGIYILKTPARPVKINNCYHNRHGSFEYRVAHAQAIDNVDYSDLYLPLIFGASVVHADSDKAMQEAIKLEEQMSEEYGFGTEYGVSIIEKNVYFPNMTSEEARKALDSFVTKDQLSEEELSKLGLE